MNRRDFTKLFGGIVATSAVGGATVLASSGGARASAGGSISDPAAVTSDDGEITYVTVQATGRLNWDGFDKPAKYARIVNYVTLVQDGQEVWGEEKINDTGKIDLTQDNWANAGEETSLGGDHEAGQSGYIASDVDWGIAQENRENNYNNGYGLPSDPAPTSPFTAETDGEERKTRVKLRSLYLLFDENENELTGESGYPDRPSATSEFVVTVNNEESSTSFGDADAEGDTDDTAGVEV